MHKFHSGDLPENFNGLSTHVNQVHCHATRSAARGAYFWHMARIKCGKRSLKYLYVMCNSIIVFNSALTSAEKSAIACA